MRLTDENVSLDFVLQKKIFCVTPKIIICVSCERKFVGGNFAAQKLFGQNLSHPKNLPSTPMLPSTLLVEMLSVGF